jgi:hypothetical protein
VPERVDVGKRAVTAYEATAGREAVEQLRELAEPLRSARVLHPNATPYGGGVAEILRSEVPLLRDLGLDADWKVITGDTTFFSVTKTMHNLKGHGLCAPPPPRRARDPRVELERLTNTSAPAYPYDNRRGARTREARPSDCGRHEGKGRVTRIAWGTGAG